MRDTGSRKKGIRARALRERSRLKKSKKSGQPPGTPVYIGREVTHEVSVSVMDYRGSRFHEQAIGDLSELAAFKDSQTTTWIRVNGIHDVSVVERIGAIFGIHHLVLEDIVDTTQRPKAEDYRGYLFIAIKLLDYEEERLVSRQVSLVVGRNYLVSFREEQTGLFEPLERRIREGGSRIRESGTDYLAYCILDILVDNYFVILEKVGEQTELLEEELLTAPSDATHKKIHELKRELLVMRKSVWPVIQIVNRMSDTDSDLISDSTRPYLRDLHDHAIHTVDTVETLRDMVSGMIDIYLSSVNNRLNEIMKWLTMIATVFIPLTFLSGWYGMNFKNMPELSWPWGYPVVILVAVSIAAMMLFFFRRKGWL